LRRGEPDLAGDRDRERKLARGDTPRSGDLARSEPDRLEGDRVRDSDRSRVARRPREGERERDGERDSAGISRNVIELN
jgi:hypothetical protein